jgi:four helix bundle protein
MNKYKQLNVWQLSVDLATEVYRLTSRFPDKERFGLITQINRSVVSVSSNIAEGAGRNTDKDFAHFIGIAVGSLFELETQLIISKNLNYLSEPELSEIQSKISSIQKML